MFEVYENGVKVFTGLDVECAEYCGCGRTTIHTRADENFKIKGKYKVKCIGFRKYPCKKYNVYCNGEKVASNLSVKEICEQLQITEYPIYRSLKLNKPTKRGYTFEEVV